MNGIRGTRKRLVRLLAVLLLACATAGAATAAQDRGGEVEVIVKGVTSPFATFGLLKHLNGIPGVENVHFSLQRGLADVKLKPGATVTERQLRDAVYSAAYTPGDIHWKTPPSATTASDQ